MALEHILAAIERDTDAEVRRIDAEADERCAAAAAAARAEGELAAAERRRVVEGEIRRETERRAARASVERVRALHGARDRVVSRLLERLRGRLAGARDDAEWPATFEALLREALAGVPDATVIRVDARDRALAERLVRELAPRAAVDATLASWGGTLADDGRGLSVDNTLEARLSATTPELRLAAGCALGAFWS